MEIFEIETTELQPMRRKYIVKARTMEIACAKVQDHKIEPEESRELKRNPDEVEIISITKRQNGIEEE